MGNQKIYEMVTERILSALEAGVVPWQQPWGLSGVPRNAWNKPYRGVNVWTLMWTRGANGYKSNHWLTYNQISERGGTVRKGEKSTPIVLWKPGKPYQEFDEAKGKTVQKRPLLLKYFNVFNLDQQDGMKLTGAMQREHDRIEAGEAKVANGIDEDAECIIGTYLSRDGAPEYVEGQDDGCWFRPFTDTVHTPFRYQFDTMPDFYASIFHEFSHSTGVKKRLNRKGEGEVNHFGDDKYGFEELVAEFSASMLMAECGLDNTADNNAAYIKGWAEKIKADPKLVVQAAGKAQKSADYVLGEEWVDKPDKD